MLILEKSWNELQTIFQTPLSSGLGYIYEAQLLKAICDARAGKSTPMVRVCMDNIAGILLRDLAARGLLAPPAASALPFKQRQFADKRVATNQQRRSVPQALGRNNSTKENHNGITRSQK